MYRLETDSRKSLSEGKTGGLSLPVILDSEEETEDDDQKDGQDLEEEEEEEIIMELSEYIALSKTHGFKEKEEEYVE